MSYDEAPRRHARLRALFEEHHSAVLAYASRRTNQLTDAEDAVSEAFLVAWRRLDHVPNAANERLPWLLGIARNVVVNQRRGAARRQRLLEHIRRQPAKPLGPSQLPSVIDALSRIPESDREVLRLVAWEGLGHAEIGIVLGISPNAVAIRIHRARQRLRRALSNDAQVKGSDRIRTLLGWKGSTSSPPQRERTG